MAIRTKGLHQWWLDRSVQTKGLIVVAIPLIALIGVALTGGALQRSESEERGVAKSNFNLRNSGAAVLADAVNAETGIRGYAATGDPLFLAPYNLTLTRIRAERTSLRVAARAIGDVRQQRRVDSSTRTVLVQLANLRSSIGNGLTVTFLHSALENEKTTMDVLRRQTTDLVATPTAELIVQQGKITSLQSTIDTLDIAGLIVGILAGLAGIALFTSGISRRVVAAAANADRLGMGQPLEPVDRTTDELGRLAIALDRANALLGNRAIELTVARDEALAATQVKTAFLSHTSHELRTPLNSILGFAQLLGMSDLTAEDHDGVERILGAGRHLLALINELIDIARIESGDLNLSLESVAVAPLIEEISLLLAPLASERSIVISHHCASQNLAVNADYRRLSQVLVNLLSNAVKYNSRSGSIAITCELSGTDEVGIVVSDTGPGLTQDDLELVFVPFERLDAGRMGTEGTGIGLPLAKSLAEAMGGRLTASSVRGEGSVFTVTLPRASIAPIVRSDRDRAASPIRPTKTNEENILILYIEDNLANIEVVSRFVKGLPNARVRSVTSGRAGIESAVSDNPDIILLDLDLPDLHGSQVLRELKADTNTARIPIVILSADASPAAIHSLLDNGALAYLTKPIDLVGFAKLLRSATSFQEDRPEPATQRTPI
jgi:signal transduction histidine kinase/CheY-like chemotaxis protein